MAAPAARVGELSRRWVQLGHEVTVLTGFPNHPTGVVPPQYRRKLRRLVSRETLDGVNVVRTWLLPFPNRRAFKRMLNYVSFFVSSACTGLFLSRPDVIIATSPQLLVGLSGWWLALCKRVPLVFEVRDLWPESLTAVGMGESDSLLHRLLGKIAGFLYRHCEHIVVVTPAFKTHLMEHWNVPAEKISTIQNGVETDLFAPQVSAPELRQEWSAEDKFVVCYIGTMGLAHGLETIVDAAGILRDSNPDVLFLLVGEGAEKDRVASLIHTRGLTNVRLLDQQPRERIPAFLSAADLCLVLLKKTELFKTVIPTKMLECMACARPIILAVDGQARQILEEANAGVFIEPESAQALAQAIGQLKAKPERRESLGANGRDYVLKCLSRKQTAKTYVEVLAQLVSLRSSKQAN